MIRLPVIALILIAASQVCAQRSEVGFGIGTFNYTGDLAPTYNIQHSRFAATAFYRSNVSKVVSIRAAMVGGDVAATDQSSEPFSRERAASFNIFLMEASLAMEYHFLNWRDSKHILRYSPYLFGGLALFGIAGNAEKSAEYSNIQAAIPFGVGIKYIVNPRWYVGLEFGARKTFFDYLDNVSVGDPDNKNFRYGNPFTDDAYYFLGLSVTRTFYDIPCPTNPYK